MGALVLQLMSLTYIRVFYVAGGFPFFATICFEAVASRPWQTAITPSVSGAQSRS